MALLLHVISGGIVAGSVYALTAVGLTLIFGVLRVANFAQGEFYMIGGLLLYVLASHSVPYPVALLMAVAGGAVIGMVVEFVAVRPLRDKPHEAVFLSTFAVSVAAINGVSTLIGGQPLSVPGIGGGVVRVGDFVIVTIQGLVVFVGLVISIGLLYILLSRTRTGIALRAIADDRLAANLSGINVNHYYSIAFAIGAALAALAGALIAPLFTLNPYVGQSIIIKAFVVVVVAGLGSIRGAVLVAMLLGLSENFAAGYLLTDFRDFVAYILIAVVILARPHGLFGTKARVA